jgi:hypothetical protein
MASGASALRREVPIPFSIFSPFGFNGRFLYGRASFQF